MDKTTGSTRGPNCNSGGGFRSTFGSSAEPKELRCADWPNCVKAEAKYEAAPTHAAVCPDWPECAEK
jgi:hypothetical protein